MGERDSEVDFARARRAVLLGLADERTVEAAILARDRGEPGPADLYARLPLTPAQRLALSGTSLPAEVAAALRDPARAIAHFVLLEELARGGMGVVHRAYDLRLSRQVALKLLRRLDDPRARRLFAREAHLAASLALPSVAAIHEVGEHEGAPFIAMQLVEGETLARLAPAKDPRRAAELLRDAARAVESAHARGVVHRDLKPTNLMVDREGRLFVLDFGIALLVDAALGASAADGAPGAGAEGAAGASSLGVTGVIAGTPEYMAPEQARGAGAGATDARTDVYGLGACLYELLAGRPPFAAADRGEVIAQVLRDRPARLRDLAPGAPAALERIVHHALEKDPGRRYGSAAALAEDLDRFLDGRPVLAPPVDARGEARSRRRAALIAMGLIALAAGGAALASRPGAGRGAGAGPGRGAGSDARRNVRPQLIFRDAVPADIPAITAEGGLVCFGRVLPPLAPDAPPRREILSVPAAGGEARAVLEVPDDPTGVVLRGNALYWCDLNSAPPEGGSRVYRRLFTTGVTEVLYSGAPRGTTLEDASGLAAHGRLLLAVDEVGGSIFRLSGEAPGEAVRIAGPRYAGGFLTEHSNAISVCGGTVYVSDPGETNVSRPGVYACAVDGGPLRTLHEGAPLVRPRGIAAGFDAVYVADAGASAIFVLPLEGGPPEVLCQGEPFQDLSAIALDGRSLYVADGGSTRDAWGRLLARGRPAVYRIELEGERP